MIKEIDANGKTLKEFGNNFSVRQIKAFEKKYGKDSTNELIDHLNIYGEGQLFLDDTHRRLFVEEKAE